jgi:bifunctional enzyme CysN/CysC/sulfate adenylyltransferase subunit 1
VNRPNNPTDHALHDFRGLSGQIAGGIVKVGQKVTVLPSGFQSTIKQIWTLDGMLDEAFCPQSVTLVLDHDLDISRGDTIVDAEDLPGAASELHAKICWMNPRPLTPGKQYFLKHTNQTVKAAILSIDHKINISTLDKETGVSDLAMNDIGEIRLKTAKPIIYDGYATNRLTGSFILIELGTNATVAAGMLLPPTEVARPEYRDFAI